MDVNCKFHCLPPSTPSTPSTDLTDLTGWHHQSGLATELAGSFPYFFFCTQMTMLRKSLENSVENVGEVG